MSLSEVVSGEETPDQYQTNTYFTVRPLTLFMDSNPPPCPEWQRLAGWDQRILQQQCCKWMPLVGTVEAPHCTTL